MLCCTAVAPLAWMHSASGAEVRPPTKPNFVFILIDDMGWVDGGCFGSEYYRTPNLDTLAAAGMQFTQAYAACAVRSPTRAAIMTGKYPARLHLTDWIPGERHNLAGSQAEKRRELALRLDSWLQRVGAQMPIERHANSTPL
jgi:Sulfatase